MKGDDLEMKNNQVETERLLVEDDFDDKEIRMLCPPFLLHGNLLNGDD